MTREQEPKAVLTAILICVAALGCLGFVALVRVRNIQATSGGTVMSVDTSDWAPYRNDAYGFTLLYPPPWTVDTEWLVNDPPYVAFGDPLSGTTTYTLRVFIEDNSSSLASADYVHALLTAAHAGGGGNASRGPTANSAPLFQEATALTVNGYPAYELYGVFELDHNAEQIYVAHGEIALRFDFPLAEENPDISLPVENNQVAHEIVNTLDFTK